MSWLRIDDGFATNKKIAALSDRELRVWLRVLCWCARAEDPTVDQVTMREVNGLTHAKVARYAEVELLDPSGSSFEIHDWAKYLSRDMSGADRQARWRARRNGKETH